MNIEGEFHPDVLHFLPAILLVRMVCECCEKEAGHALTFSWGFWSLHFFFGVNEDTGDHLP